jgi:hypothetical protein
VAEAQAVTTPSPMPCPWGHCFAMALPLTHRTNPTDPREMVKVYPMHDVVGTNSWFGRCPASQLMVPVITPAGRAVLMAADAQYARMLAERINKKVGRLSPKDRERLERAADEADRRYRETKPEPPHRDDYFPGRPADEPEPGIGEQPAKKLPLTQIGQHLGKAEQMSTREQHIEMIAAARRAIGEAEEKLAMALAALEQLEKVTSTLPPGVTAAHALVHAAVGGSEALPESGIAMRANITAALDTVGGDGSLTQSVALVRSRISALASQLRAASSAGETYAAIPK